MATKLAVRNATGNGLPNLTVGGNGRRGAPQPEPASAGTGPRGHRRSSCLDNLTDDCQAARSVLNPASPLPLYHQLAERLTSGISAGDWAPGERLPSEPELARQFGIGRPTVRQALEVLVRRGMAERRRGSGTYVTATAGSVDLFTLSGTVSSFRSGGHELQTELLSGPDLSQVSSADAPHPFAGRVAVTFRRLGKVERAPVLVEDLWLDPLTFPGLEKLPLRDTPVSQVVRQHYHLEPTDGEQSFRVEAPPKAIARALQLSEDTPLLSIQRTLNFPSAKAAVFSRLYCRTDRVTFSQKLGGFQT